VQLPANAVDSPSGQDKIPGSGLNLSKLPFSFLPFTMGIRQMAHAREHGGQGLLGRYRVGSKRTDDGSISLYPQYPVLVRVTGDGSVFFQLRVQVGHFKAAPANPADKSAAT